MGGHRRSAARMVHEMGRLQPVGSDRRGRHRLHPRLRGARSTCCCSWSTATRWSIYDIPLAAVVDAFVAEVAAWETVDLQTLSEFLVIAAVLIELKSRRLLPGRDDVDPDEELVGWEERDLLLARLLECQAYAAAADGFAVLMEQAARSVPRTAGLDARPRGRRPRPARGGDPRRRWPPPSCGPRPSARCPRSTSTT